MKLTDLDDIYPEEFFNISQPDVPIVQIQVRTTNLNPDDDNDNNNDYNADDITDPEKWTEVNFEPGKNNYFNTMRVEDSGGTQRVTLSFFDKNFVNLENAIVKTLIATKAANEIAIRNGESSITSSGEEVTLKLSNQNMVNLRVRFGYSEVTTDAIDDTSFNGSDYSERTKGNKTVIRSPWLYLQMIGIKFNLRGEGLFVEISAFSVLESFLSKAKMLRKFAVLNGTPEEIINSLCEKIKAVSDGFSFEIIDTPELPVTTDPNRPGFIQINLGSEANETRKSWRTMRSVFNEVMSKIPQKMFDVNDGEISSNEEDGSSAIAAKGVSYGYVAYKDDDGIHMDFRYPSPTKSTQSNVRTYAWKEYGQSIVKDLNISSQVDFASLNAQVFTTNGELSNLSVAATSDNTETNDAKSDTKLSNRTDVTDYLNNEDFGSVFVSNSIGVDTGITTGSTVGNNIVKNLNQGVFTGSITIPGDPFYLFDNKLSPFQYYIKILIQRPGYLDSTDSYKGVTVSYLSGYYVIKKITHMINSSGFNTTLEVTRWPIEG